jgi:hypothetical protein
LFQAKGLERLASRIRLDLRVFTRDGVDVTKPYRALEDHLGGEATVKCHRGRGSEHISEEVAELVARGAIATADAFAIGDQIHDAAGSDADRRSREHVVVVPACIPQKPFDSFTARSALPSPS